MRSSCEASATKRRSLLSLSTRAANDSSIRLSIVFSVFTNRPTSVFGFTSGKRAVKSPAAMRSAVSSTWASGLSPTVITFREARAIKTIKIKPIKTNKPCNLPSVRSISSNDLATTTFPKPDGRGRAITRKSGPGVSIVKGSSCAEVIFSSVIAVR